MPKTVEEPVNGQNGPPSVSSDPGKAEPAKSAKQIRRDYQRDRAITFYLSGHSQERAYNLAFKPRGDPDRRNSMACEWFARQSVVERTEQLRNAAHISDLDSVGAYLHDLLDGINKTRAAGNWTAFSNLMRQRQQTHGLARMDMSVSVEHRMSDVELITKIVGDDPVLVAAMRKRIGADNTFH